jgi:hypothetical protein
MYYHHYHDYYDYPYRRCRRYRCCNYLWDYRYRGYDDCRYYDRYRWPYSSRW